MTGHWLKTVIDSIADRGRELLGLDSNQLKTQDLAALCQRLLAGRGEASGIALSQEILHRYQEMSAADKLAFYQMLATDFSPRLEKIQASMNDYLAAQSAKNLIALNAAVESPRQELFRRLNMAPNGTARLVALRADLLKVLRDQPTLQSLDYDLKHLLSSWFNRGFLRLSAIDWNSSAYILEKLINYEAVHEIQGWDDLRRRLMQDRRCFAFFHPAMPDEPLIFVEVAFVQGLSDEVSHLLNPAAPELDPQQADTAIFYSINNTQAGLRGISFGNFLIKQVLIDLATEFPMIKTASTLSPMPGFAAAIKQWLSSNETRADYVEFDDILKRNHVALAELASQASLTPGLNYKVTLAKLLTNPLDKNNKPLGTLLSELALSYLTQPASNGTLSDPVAMFHLSNGARLERLNPFADMSEHGISTAYGMMVNYLYDLNEVERNHEAFVSKGTIMMSDTVRKSFARLARPEPEPEPEPDKTSTD